jgi:hypothetical protein
VNVTTPPIQAGLLSAVMLTDGVTVVVTVIVIALEVAVLADKHAAFEVITQVITALFAIEAGVNVAAVTPATTTLSTFQMYEGDTPPFVGVAVNVTDWEAQVGFPPAVIAIKTLGVTEVFTTTEEVPDRLVHPFTVVVKLYVPAIAVVETAKVGFCTVLV